jgi:hypothetical protein
MFIDGGCEICVTSEEVAKELNIGWICANWKMITDDGNPSDLSNVGESLPFKVHIIVIPMPILSARSGSEHVILDCCCETYARKWERNFDDGRCMFTLSAGDGSEQVTFVTTFPGDNRDRFTSSSRDLYA